MSNAEPTFLFYDIETTGLNPCFDQCLQFAAIRTDSALNEIERHEIFVRLNPDLTPDPKAMATHQLSLDDCQKGLCEYEALKKIHALMNTPQTISLGYNSLSFDEEFLRFGFYRNLLTPYTHQFQNNCKRMDLFPITAAYALYKPDILHWPRNEEQIILKLDQLSACNQLATGQAHNALVDVEATIALAKKLKTEQKIWDYLAGFFDKNTDAARLQQLKRMENGAAVALLLNGKWAKTQFQTYALSLGLHQHYNNRTVWLRLDTLDFSEYTLSELIENTFSIFRKPAEKYFVLPMEERFIAKMPEILTKQMQKNIDFLLQNPTVFAALQTHHVHYQYPEYPDIDIDAQLYKMGFPDPTTQKILNHFHEIPLKEKANYIRKIQHPLYHALGLRLLARNYPELLIPQELADFQAEQAREKIDYRGRKKLTAEQAQIT